MALAGSFYENRLNPLILSGRFQNIPFRDKLFYFDIFICLCYVFQRNYIYSKMDYQIIPKQNNFPPKNPDVNIHYGIIPPHKKEKTGVCAPLYAETE